MQVTYELQLTDWRASDRFFALQRKAKRASWRGWWFFRVWFFLLLLPIVVAPLYYLATPEFKNAWSSNGVGAMWPLGVIFIPLGILALLWFGAPRLQHLAFRDSGFYQKQIVVSIELEGLGGYTFIPWMHINTVEESEAHIFLVLSNNTVFIIPKRAFESELEARNFATRCREGRQKI